MGDRRISVRVVSAAAAVAGALGWRAHQAALEKLRDAIREERIWSRRLRDELHEKQVRSQPLGEDEDVRDLVLRTAMGLLGAQKGILLSRADEDGDGDLDMVCARGFNQDPEHLPVVQRFTREVLANDEMVREDRVKGDAEIKCLVAVPVYLFDRFHGVVVCANRPGGFKDVDDNVLLALGDQAGAALHSQRLHREMRDVHRGAVQMLSELLAAADVRLGEGAVEAATLAAAVARRLNLEGPQRDALVCAAALRDVGLLVVPEAILAKAGPLTGDERALMERHPQVGFEVIGRIRELRDVAFGVLYHHERHDGLGYPARLAGDAIPRSARVVSVIDAYCAITHERPHRPARSSAEAIRELVEHSGSQFDPEIVALLAEEVERPQLRSVDAGTAEAIMEWLLVPERRHKAQAAADAEAVTAGIDGLTQLGAHRAFREAAAEAAAGDAPFAVLLVELDGLRSINERDGYATGDRTLVAAARKLQRAAARAGLAAYRDGAARFGVVAPGRDAEAARKLLEDVNTEFALGPAVRFAAVVRRPGQDGDAVIASARRELNPVSPEAIGIPEASS
jgi:GGDEF domain-containing protein